MAQHEDSSSHRRSRGRRTRKPGRRQEVADAWSRWRVEIILVLAVALAIFLLVERMQIRQFLWWWLRWGFQALLHAVGGVQRSLTNFVQNTTASDLTAYVLLLIVLVVVAWRIRWRLMRTPHLAARECPRCGSEVRRMHRRWTERILSLYLPVRRYGCTNRDCSWLGPRVWTARSERV